MAFTLLSKKQSLMLLTDFKAKLRRIDTRLVIDHANPVTRENGLKFAPLYLKKARRSQVNVSKFDRNAVHASHAKYLDALESGVMDTYVTSICLDFIPEYDIFNMEYTKLAVVGWRSIGLMLVNQKIASLDKVKKVFGCSGLGESDYDKMDIFKKIEFAKRLEDGNI
jgi:hypothetical protein